MTISNVNTVATANGQLTLDGNAVGFYAVDRAIITSGPSRGNPIEFIRAPDGAVRWIRYIGRIARKE